MRCGAEAEGGGTSDMAMAAVRSHVCNRMLQAGFAALLTVPSALGLRLAPSGQARAHSLLINEKKAYANWVATLH